MKEVREAVKVIDASYPGEKWEEMYGDLCAIMGLNAEMELMLLMWKEDRLDEFLHVFDNLIQESVDTIIQEKQ